MIKEKISSLQIWPNVSQILDSSKLHLKLSKTFKTDEQGQINNGINA